MRFNAIQQLRNNTLYIMKNYKQYRIYVSLEYLYFLYLDLSNICIGS